MGGFTGRTIKQRPLLGEAVPMIGSHVSGKFLPVGTTIKRADYPELSATFPTLYGLHYNNNVIVSDTQVWSGIAYNGSIYVAVGGYSAVGIALGLTTTSTSTNVMTSADGVTWVTQVGVLPVAQMWSGVAWGNGVFVAVSYTAGTTFAYSYDGLTWYSATSTFSTTYGSVLYGQGLFLAIPSTGYPGQRQYVTSPDGVTWTTRNFPISIWGYGGTTSFQNGKFFCSEEKIFSNDGLSWVSMTGSSGMTGAVAWDGHKYWLARTADSTGSLYSSPDGSVWTLAHNFNIDTLVTVIATKGWLFVFSNYNSGACRYSTDGGSTWGAFSIAAGYYYAQCAVVKPNGRITLLSPNCAVGYEVYAGYDDTVTLTGPAGWYVRVM